MKKIILSLSLVFASIFMGVLAAPVHAAPSGLYLNPSSGTYQKEATFAVQLRLNAGSNSGVQANLAFDAAQLQVVSVSNQGSALANVTTTYDNDSGRISIYSVSGSNSGDRLITTITLRAVGGGTATLNFTGNNMTLGYLLLVPIWSSVDTNNASYTISVPSSPPPTGGTSPSSPGSNAHPTTPTQRNVIVTPNTSTSQLPSSDQPTSSDEPTATPDSRAPSSLFNKLPDFETTPPDQEPWESYRATVPTSVLIVPWLPIIVIASSAVIMSGIYFAYRRTHMTKSMRRLLASIVTFTNSVTTKQPALQRIRPFVTTLLPALKLLTYTQPKLLASGVKQKLLSAGKNFPPFKR